MLFCVLPLGVFFFFSGGSCLFLSFFFSEPVFLEPHSWSALVSMIESHTLGVEKLRQNLDPLVLRGAVCWLEHRGRKSSWLLELMD